MHHDSCHVYRVHLANMNSTAVIIGAMLISPLMGGIMNIAYGIAVYDMAHVRQRL
ncbi:MAG: hypothetical protein ACLVLH_15690 [Eisenbergiella massiliensis]